MRSLPEIMQSQRTAAMQCTCGIGRTPCNSAFVYDTQGRTVAEIPADMVPSLRSEFTAVCAGAGLQKLNQINNK